MVVPPGLPLRRHARLRCAFRSFPEGSMVYLGMVVSTQCIVHRLRYRSAQQVAKGFAPTSVRTREFKTAQQQSSTYVYTIQPPRQFTKAARETAGQACQNNTTTVAQQPLLVARSLYCNISGRSHTFLGGDRVVAPPYPAAAPSSLSHQRSHTSDVSPTPRAPMARK